MKASIIKKFGDFDVFEYTDAATPKAAPKE